MNGSERELGQIQQKLEDTSKTLDQLRKNITTLFEKIEKGTKTTLQEISSIKGSIDTAKQIASINQKNNETKFYNIEECVDEYKDKSDKAVKATEILNTKIDTSIKTFKVIGATTVAAAAIITGIIAILQFIATH